MSSRHGPALWVALLLLALAAVAAAVADAFLRDMRLARERVQGRSQLLASPLGDVEYLEGGSGPPVLVVHGSGGGFDQGELIARAVLGDDLRWVAPSRFGYLRSTFEQGATFDDQAHAYARLLDHLQLPRVAVVALSHGGPSALLFATLYPHRVSALTLISAGVVSTADPAQQQASLQGRALMRIFQHDFAYWAISRGLRGRLLALMGAGDADALDAGQRRLVDRIVDGMNPVSLRSAGTVFDHHARMPGERIAAVHAPTLILHAQDDSLQIFGNAEFAAATIPDATLRAFERGGHLLMVVEQAALRSSIRQHVLAHAPIRP